MLKLSKERREQLIKNGKKLYRTDALIKPRQIDFTKPWWKIFFAFPFRSAFVMIETVIRTGLESLLPLWLGLIMRSGDWSLAIWLALGLVVLRITEQIAFFQYQTIITSLQYNVDLAAKEFFLTVDPEFHVTKSSGQIISKTSSTGREFMRLFGNLFYSLIPAVSGFVAVLITLARYDWKIGLIMGAFFIVITGVSTVGNIFMASNITPAWIKARDAWSAIGVENLQQIWLIRSTFSVPEQLERSQKITHEAVGIRALMNLGYDAFFTIVNILYLISVMTLLMWAIDQVSQGIWDVTLAISLVATYLNASQVIIRIGSIVTSTVEAFSNLDDMWDFIRNFGSQTYPVLPEDNDSNL